MKNPVSFYETLRGFAKVSGRFGIHEASGPDDAIVFCYLTPSDHIVLAIQTRAGLSAQITLSQEQADALGLALQTPDALPQELFMK